MDCVNPLWPWYGAQRCLSQKMDFCDCFPSLDLAQSWLQPHWQLRRAELNLPIRCSGDYHPECRSTALHVTPRCPTHISQGCTKDTVLVCQRAILPPFLPPCVCCGSLARIREAEKGGAMGQERLRVSPLLCQCKLELQAPQPRGGRVWNHLCVYGVGCPRPRAVSAIALCFQTSFWEVL